MTTGADKPEGRGGWGGIFNVRREHYVSKVHDDKKEIILRIFLNLVRRRGQRDRGLIEEKVSTITEVKD